MSDPVNALADFVRRHPRLFVLTGAGVSTESGIPAYRDERGVWRQRRPIQYQQFITDPLARQRYWARSMIGWPNFANADSGPSHRALTELQRAGRIQQLVTQNVDRLHQRAGSVGVIDLHGRLDRAECLNCGYRLQRQSLQTWLTDHNPEFLFYRERAEIGSAPDGDADLDDADFSRFRPPSCPRCDGLIKPAVVFFGENVPKARVALSLRQLDAADALLVVGSSLTVFSGYRFCRAASAQRKPIAAIGLGATRADAELSLKVSGRCGETLRALNAALGVAG